jgi:hypothetical protein
LGRRRALSGTGYKHSRSCERGNRERESALNLIPRAAPTSRNDDKFPLHLQTLCLHSLWKIGGAERDNEATAVPGYGINSRFAKQRKRAFNCVTRAPQSLLVCPMRDYLIFITHANRRLIHIVLRRIDETLRNSILAPPAMQFNLVCLPCVRRTSMSQNLVSHFSPYLDCIFFLT